MISEHEKRILDAFYKPVPMGPNDQGVLQKVMKAVEAAEPELKRLREENAHLRKENERLKIERDKAAEEMWKASDQAQAFRKMAEERKQ